MLKAAFISKHVNTQSEAVRAGVNLVVHAVDTSLFILDFELDPTLSRDEEFSVWLEVFKDEMEAPVYTNIKSNEQYGFAYLDTKACARKIKEMDIIVPF
jgi:hypothetical protein